MIDTFVKLEDSINNCLLGRLFKPFHEKDHHPEYHVRIKKLEQYFPKLIDLLENIDFREQLEISSSTLYCLLILYLELKTEGPWNTDIKAQEYPVKLDKVFGTKYNITFDEMLLKDDFYSAQEVFDKCIKELHQIMTLNDLKKYPALVEVYCLLIKNVSEYNVILNPVTVLPVSLLLIDDYIFSNKVKGLHCCLVILQCLNSDAFTSGNYYEVVYRSLKNNILEKDTEVTQALFKCFPNFLKILPPEVKKSKLNDVFSSVIDQLHTETNLYRKADCFDFTTQIIEMLGVNCVKTTFFKEIICDNLDICSNKDVYEILIQHVMKCLLMWIKYCWCIWTLPADEKMLSSLIKTLYVAKDEDIILQIQNLILTLIHLCTNEAQKQIYSCLEAVPKGVNGDFLSKINKIKENIHPSF